jgi:hypothetical protein
MPETGIETAMTRKAAIRGTGTILPARAYESASERAPKSLLTIANAAALSVHEMHFSTKRKTCGCHQNLLDHLLKNLPHTSPAVRRIEQATAEIQDPFGLWDVEQPNQFSSQNGCDFL